MRSLLRVEREQSASAAARAELDAAELRADLVSESERRLALHDRLETERGRSTELQAQAAALRSAIDSLDAEIGSGSLALAHTQALLRSEREAVAGTIAQTESDCDELLTEAAAAVDELRAQLDAGTADGRRSPPQRRRRPRRTAVATRSDSQGRAFR